MTLEEVKAVQRASYFPVAIASFQFKAVAADVTFSGVYVDAYGKSLEGFSYTVGTSAKSLRELRNGISPDVPLPADYVGVVGKLSAALRVNTGRNPATNANDIPITDAHSWIEYATDRYIIGQVL